MKYWDNAYCEKISMIFKKCVTLRHLDLFAFIDYFTNSEVLQELYDFNEAIISQGELYIIGLLIEEFPELESKTSCEFEGEIAEWLGYLYGFLMIEKVDTDTLAKIDWECLYNNYDFFLCETCRNMKGLIFDRQLFKGNSHIYEN